MSGANPKFVVVTAPIPTLEQFRIAIRLSKKDARKIERRVQKRKP